MKRRILWVVAIVLLLPVAIVGALMLVVQSEWAEHKVEQMVSAKLNREVEVAGIGLKPGWPFLVTIARLRIGNPDWAREKDLVDAEGLYARVAVPPLLKGLVVVPYVGARRANANLQMDGERATWRFGPKSDEPSKLYLGMVYMDDGHISFVDANEKTDLKVDVKGSAGAEGLVTASGTGTFRGQPTKATARVPRLDPQHESPLNVSGEATVGKTHGKAEGTFTTDAKELDLKLQLAGETFKALNPLTGMLLPDSPPYSIQGHLRHVNNDWIFENFQGKVGVSDLRGGLTYSKREKRPFMKASLKSKLLDIGDLGPMIKAPPREGSGSPKSAEQQQKAEELKVKDRLLPDERFSTESWTKMDADVTLDAERIQRPDTLPLTAMSTHLILKDGVITLDPLNFGMAEGVIRTRVVLDGTQKPMQGTVKADVQGLHLAALFPTVKSMQDALGTLYAHTELQGRGDSIAAMLGTSTGQASLAVGGGRVSSLILELVDLHVPEIVMLLGKNYQQSNLNCAVSTLNVKDGVAGIESFVIDTDTNEIRADGNVSLKEETVQMEVKPYAKHATVISLNSPLIIKGKWKKPKGYPEPMHLIAKAGGAVALGAIAPPLALLALIDTGKGKDQDCAKYLAEAKARGAKPKGNAQPQAVEQRANREQPVEKNPG
jgi:AsmA family protein